MQCTTCRQTIYFFLPNGFGFLIPSFDDQKSNFLIYKNYTQYGQDLYLEFDENINEAETSEDTHRFSREGLRPSPTSKPVFRRRGGFQTRPLDTSLMPETTQALPYRYCVD